MSSRSPKPSASTASWTMSWRLALTIPTVRPSASSFVEQVEHPGERLELGVERRVELAVGVRELVRLLGVELAHLLLEVPGADAGHQHLVGEVSPEHGRRRVPVGREDHPAGVDDRAVEVEEDDGEAH